ncbi:glycerol-3-phosphate dehydrogenase [Longilinea arvoryzae]|uniref:Glycerol-3-phosphate dehydrogenase n=1 Tax=Longilinea arvoryzae TaxID=360412 RepID=A0A0K8MY29_9CHLR|nr:FAD-dependent oxidoreductase [Longilinea arvoryzae]GAP15911.1 glycerol-3-phosphate dehydrogenase [Longilinea arvoryzae]
MWGKDSRENIWSTIERSWDLLVVGGGISGAGIFNYAARAGLRVLLVEANDFAFGASGRSGKQIQVWNDSGLPVEELVRERDRLLREAPNLVRSMACYQAAYPGQASSSWPGKSIPARDLTFEVPHLRTKGLSHGKRGEGACLDDARLVLRLIREGVNYGGVAINYVRAEQLLFTAYGQVCGAVLRDRAQGEDGRTAEAQARGVINTSGTSCDELHSKAGGRRQLRQWIGSHLFLPGERLPLTCGLTVSHPRDGRPLSFIPWNGVVSVGGMHLEYRLPEDMAEPSISAQEIEYLLEGLKFAFPTLELGLGDVLACHAGVQQTPEGTAAAPVLGTLREENGLVSVTGGRLGAFRLTAARALNALRARLPGLRPFSADQPIFEPDGEMPYSTSLDPAGWSYLAGRYGRELPALLASTPVDELQSIYPQLPAMWAELHWAAHDGAVVHLDDLLLRRLRLGLQVKRGGLYEIEDMRAMIQPKLGWDNIRWQWEVARYARIHELYYSV